VSSLPLVLVVDPAIEAHRVIEDALTGLARTVGCRDFPTARRLVLEQPPDVLVTNFRIEAFNGLHLVHLARVRSWKTRSVVYQLPHDANLARLILETGASYERYERLPSAIASYLRRDLPAEDRRDPGRLDRREPFRGGRRSKDVPSKRH
jgi:CheY-like chemotaxis protein